MLLITVFRKTCFINCRSFLCRSSGHDSRSIQVVRFAIYFQILLTVHELVSLHVCTAFKNSNSAVSTSKAFKVGYLVHSLCKDMRHKQVAKHLCGRMAATAFMLLNLLQLYLF